MNKINPAILCLLLAVTLLVIPVSAAEPSWTLVTDHPEFPLRLTTSVVTFHDKMWVIGGFLNDMTYYNDVWYSSDGNRWNQATRSAPFSPRYGHTTLVFDDKMWVIGGYDNTHHFKNDVWYTSDGITWTRATAAAAFPPRHMPASPIFDGKMWIIGGEIAEHPGVDTNDVWYSSDGVTWHQAVKSAPFSSRMGHGAVVFDNKLWVIGGIDETAETPFFNDVWYSSDGIQWNKMTGNAGFSPRTCYTSLATNDRIWVIGGNSPSGWQNDIWESTDGKTWSLTSSGREFSQRVILGDVLYKNRIWMISGTPHAASAYNNVWYSPELNVPEPSDRIVVNKTISSWGVKQGTDMKVTISFSNLGSSSVHDIQMMDNSHAEFPLVTGKSQIQISETLMPNETRILVYTVHAAKAGRYTLPAASVLYAGDDGNYHKAASNTVNVEVLAPLFPAERTSNDQPGDPFSGIMNGVSSFFFTVFPNSQENAE